MKMKLSAGLLAVVLALFLAGGVAEAAPSQHGGPGGRGGRGVSGLIQATATVTGLSLEQVRTELQGGKSLAQIAQDNGHTADEVIASARSAYQARLAQAVSEGRITQAQADAALQRFDQEAPTVMSDTTLGQRAGDCGSGSRPTGGRRAGGSA